jgi:hypothetical protein
MMSRLLRGTDVLTNHRYVWVPFSNLFERQQRSQLHARCGKRVTEMWLTIVQFFVGHDLFGDAAATVMSR